MPTSETSAVPLPRRLLWRRLVAVTAGALVVGIAVGGSVWFVMRPVPALVERFTMNPDGSAALTVGVERSLAITPDGTRVIYVGNRGTSSSSVRSIN